MRVDRVGKYRIIALLGQGGMASVFLSVVPGPAGVNKLLVVKLLRDELSADEDFLAMFLNEARLAARLNHANVVQTYEVGLEAGNHFLAMDYLDGQPLHAVLRKASRSGMPLDLHVRILAESLTGLHYAHTLRDFDGTPLCVVHRDVSPQNVFVTYDGQVKVVDFGIAKAVGAATNTQSGTFKGKLSYVAPEQAAGDAIDARADVFSVGVMLWEAIAGRRFAQGESQTAVLGRRLSGREPRIREVVPDVDPELADICDRAMAHLPAGRYATALDFRDALEGFLERSSKRTGPREIGVFVTGLFVEEREKIRLVIDEQMKRLQRETSTVLPMPTIDVFPGARDPTPVTSIESRAAAERAAAALRGARVLDGGDPGARVTATPATGTSSVPGSQGTLVATNLTPSAAPSGLAGRTLLVALAAVAVAFAGALAAVLLTKSTPSSVAVGGPESPANEIQRGALIKLSITFGPPGATAKLDGVSLVESPFVAQAPRDGSMHRIVVEGPGLEPETRMLSYEKDVLVTVSLQAAQPPAAQTATPTGSSPTPAAERVKRPGSDRTKPPRTSRGIDEKDPYKQ
jgi:eukaryotic-like serine/threonine-protein kinase